MNNKSKGFLSIRILSSFAALLCLLLFTTTGFAQNLKNVHFVVSLGDSSDVQFFNDFLLDDDIISSRGRHIKLFTGVTHSKTAIIRQSVVDLEEDINLAANENIRIDQVWYNPEHWSGSNTTPDELSDLFSAIRKARALACNKNAKLGVAPDVVLLEKYGDKFALMTDIFGGNAASFQLKSESLKDFRSEVERLISFVRKGSKTVPIYIQISLSPPLWETITLPNGKKQKVKVRDSEGKKVLQPIPAELALQQIEAVKDLVQGIVLYHTRETKHEMQRLILMRNTISE